MIAYQKLLAYLLVPFVILSAYLVSAITGKEDSVKSSSDEKEDIIESSSKDKVTFVCRTDEYNGKMVPATVANNPKLDEATTIILWKPDNDYFGEKWNPEKRCQEVAKRFQKIHDRDGLKYVVATVDTWVPDRDISVVCGVKEKEVPCYEDDLLFTLEATDEPDQVLAQLIDRRKFPSTKPELVRGQKQRVYYDLSNILNTEQSAF
ncbi:COP23 domain-containing protein [Crocosphaera sp. XPORK-15E]|nr:COP23 domain-containing protein [Crocosphaera sp. XPORK-15E]